MKRKTIDGQEVINQNLITKEYQESFYENRMKSSESDVLCKLCEQYNCICETQNDNEDEELQIESNFEYT